MRFIFTDDFADPVRVPGILEQRAIVSISGTNPPMFSKVDLTVVVEIRDATPCPFWR
jgi:hypothetical protein